MMTERLCKRCEDVPPYSPRADYCDPCSRIVYLERERERNVRRGYSGKTERSQPVSEPAAT